MNKISLRLLVLLMISFFLFASATAQKKTQKKVKASDVFEVRLPVSVTDKKKQFVANLTGKDFIVLENGRRQKIELFSKENNNLPVYAGILLDTSSSAKSKLPFFKEAVGNFAYSLIRSPENKAAFMTFDKEVYLRQDFTQKMDLLQREIDKVKETGNRNSLYDALWLFCDEKSRNAPGRRVIIVISDGEDNLSRVKLEDVIDLAQRTETVIYPISTSEILTDKNRNEKLMRLAKETGGAAFFVSDKLDIERAFVKILKEIDSQYLITYRPKNQKRDGKERKIEVRLREKKYKSHEVRTKTKYRMVKTN
jgi:Ca-activated chloride channel family protein